MSNSDKTKFLMSGSLNLVAMVATGAGFVANTTAGNRFWLIANGLLFFANMLGLLWNLFMATGSDEPR